MYTCLSVVSPAICGRGLDGRAGGAEKGGRSGRTLDRRGSSRGQRKGRSRRVITSGSQHHLVH